MSKDIRKQSSISSASVIRTVEGGNLSLKKMHRPLQLKQSKLIDDVLEENTSLTQGNIQYIDQRSTFYTS
jgi:hypothetical protein